MDTMRDPIRVDAWRESLERSRARLGKPPLRPVERPQPGLRRDHATHGEAAREIPAYWRLGLRALAKRSMTLVMLATGMAAIVLLAVTMSSNSQHRSVQVSVTAVRRHVGRAAVRSSAARPAGSAVPVGSGPAAPTACRLTDRSAGYVNPLAHADVVSERIDQGVDYAGSGALIAIGAARITFLATADTGWPGSVHRLSTPPWS